MNRHNSIKDVSRKMKFSLEQWEKMWPYDESGYVQCYQLC